MSDGAGSPTEADYAWVEGWEAYCVAFVEARVPEMVLYKTVGKAGTLIGSVPEAREWASAQLVPGGRSVVQARRIGGWVVTVEVNGYQATLPEVIRRVSEGSRAIVVFRDIHAHTSFLYAMDGVVTRSFDPLVPDDPTPWDGPPLPEESGLDFGSSHPMAAAFAVAERLTGVRLTPDLLEDTGSWVARGHYPFRALPGPNSHEIETTKARREALEQDPGPPHTIPNCFWLHPSDDPDDDVPAFLPGWLGWVQLLLAGVGLAVAFLIGIAGQARIGTGFFEDLSVLESLLLGLCPFVLLKLADAIGPLRDRVARSLGQHEEDASVEATTASYFSDTDSVLRQ